MVEVEGDYPEESDVSSDYSYGGFNVELLDNRRDLLFVMDQLTKIPPKGLNGIIDVDNTGVVG